VVSAERYLADAVAAAAAAREFAAVLEPLGPALGAPELRRVVPRLDAALTRARLAGQRLGAERLEDRRLEEGRSRAAPFYALVVEAMEAVVDAARRGDTPGATRAVADLDAALESLRTEADEVP
jgi:hypothetical protein